MDDKYMSQKVAYKKLEELKEIVNERKDIEKLLVDARRDFYHWLDWAKQYDWYGSWALQNRLEFKYYKLSKRYLKPGTIITELKDAGASYFTQVKKYERAIERLKLREEKLIKQLLHGRVPRSLMEKATGLSTPSFYTRLKRYEWFTPELKSPTYSQWKSRVPIHG